jgi:hypothetical protein
MITAADIDLINAYVPEEMPLEDAARLARERDQEASDQLILSIECVQLARM